MTCIDWWSCLHCRTPNLLYKACIWMFNYIQSILITILTRNFKQGFYSKGYWFIWLCVKSVLRFCISKQTLIQYRFHRQHYGYYRGVHTYHRCCLKQRIGQSISIKRKRNYPVFVNVFLMNTITFLFHVVKIECVLIKNEQHLLFWMLCFWPIMVFFVHFYVLQIHCKHMTIRYMFFYSSLGNNSLTLIFVILYIWFYVLQIFNLRNKSMDNLVEKH